VKGVGILVAEVSFLCALSNFWAAAHPETLSCPNDNEVMSHLAGRKFSFNLGHNHSCNE